MPHRLPLFTSLLIACLIALAANVNAEVTLKAGVFSPPRLAPEFSLPGTGASELTLSTYRGKLVMLGFGFSHCPEVCPVTLAHLAQARKQLGADADQVQVVYITVDPERDTLERLRSYLTAFDSTFVGGTGSEAQLMAVRKEYGIAASKVRKADGSVEFAHSAFTYLIDRQGRLRALMPYGHTAEDFVHDLKILLSEP
ncbi:MAG: SCO family protein [Pseudomarimonas sp.]